MVVSFFAAASFFVVAAVELDGVVVIVSFLLAQEVIKPTTARSATDVISDVFIGVVNECSECRAGHETASIN